AHGAAPCDEKMSMGIEYEQAGRVLSGGAGNEDECRGGEPMTQRWVSWARRLGGLALLVVLSDPPAAWGAPAPPTALPAEVVAAWEKAGAEVGWMHVNPSGFISFGSKKEVKSSEVPAFRFLTWKEGILPKLPAPGVPFGLDLAYTRVT